MNHLPDRPIADDPLMRELDAALAVDHSPEFRPRARDRVARETIRPGWHLAWTSAAAGAASLAAAALVFLAVWPAQAPVSVSPPNPIPHAERTDTAPVQPIVEPGAELASRSAVDTPAPEALVAPGIAPGQAVATPARRTPAAVPRAVPESAVIIAAAEAAALRRLFSDLSEGRVELTVAAEQVPATMPGLFLEERALSIDEIVIHPIAVQPLAPVEELELSGVHS